MIARSAELGPNESNGHRRIAGKWSTLPHRGPGVSLFVCIAVRQLVLAIGHGLTAQIVDEGLSFGGSAAMGRLLEIFLCDCRALHQRPRLVAKLAHLSARLSPLAGRTEPMIYRCLLCRSGRSFPLCCGSAGSLDDQSPKDAKVNGEEQGDQEPANQEPWRRGHDGRAGFADAEARRPLAKTLPPSKPPPSGPAIRRRSTHIQSAVRDDLRAGADTDITPSPRPARIVSADDRPRDTPRNGYQAASPLRALVFPRHARSIRRTLSRS